MAPCQPQDGKHVDKSCGTCMSSPSPSKLMSMRQQRGINGRKIVDKATVKQTRNQIQYRKHQKSQISYTSV